jgi:hypothetical protein
VGEGALRFSHSGARYLLGYGTDFFGIWDRDTPGGPVRRFPRTDDGWAEAWTAYAALEPGNVPVAETRPAPRQPFRWSVEDQAPPVQRVSGAWWLLPILVGWIGGLIAWMVNRDRDPVVARRMLVTGIAISVAGLILVGIIQSAAPH